MLKSIIPAIGVIGLVCCGMPMSAHAATTSDHVEFDFYASELNTPESRHELEQRVSVEVSDYCRESVRKDGPGPRYQRAMRNCQSLMAKRIIDAVVKHVAKLRADAFRPF